MTQDFVCSSHKYMDRRDRQIVPCINDNALMVTGEGLANVRPESYCTCNDDTHDVRFRSVSRHCVRRMPELVKRATEVVLPLK